MQVKTNSANIANPTIQNGEEEVGGAVFACLCCVHKWNKCVDVLLISDSKQSLDSYMDFSIISNNAD